MGTFANEKRNVKTGEAGLKWDPLKFPPPFKQYEFQVRKVTAIPNKKQFESDEYKHEVQLTVELLGTKNEDNEGLPYTANIYNIREVNYLISRVEEVNGKKVKLNNARIILERLGFAKEIGPEDTFFSINWEALEGCYGVGTLLHKGNEGQYLSMDISNIFPPDDARLAKNLEKADYVFGRKEMPRAEKAETVEETSEAVAAAE